MLGVADSDYDSPSKLVPHVERSPPMVLTLKEAAELVGGVPSGPDHITIRGAGTLSSARRGDLTFVESVRALERLELSPAEVVLIPNELDPPDRPATDRC